MAVIKDVRLSDHSTSVMSIVFESRTITGKLSSMCLSSMTLFDPGFGYTKVIFQRCLFFIIELIHKQSPDPSLQTQPSLENKMETSGD